MDGRSTISSMYLKISAAIITLIAFVLGLAVLLNYAKFERTFGELAESRLGFLIQDLRGTLEFGLDLGLDPTTMANTAAILAREAAKDSQILSVVVFDNQGRTLYQHRDSSPTNHPLTELSPDQIGAILHDSPTSVWRANDPETLIVGTPLINNFGRAVGGITLRYDRAFYDRELEQALIGLTRTAVLILIGASLIALVGVWLLFRGMRREISRTCTGLEDYLEQQHATDFQPEPGSALEILYAAAERRSREFQRRLRQASQILRLEQRLADRKGRR